MPAPYLDLPVAMGSRARRRRQSTHTGAWSNLKIQQALARARNALERQSIPRHPRPLCGSANRLPPASDEKAKAALRRLADALPQSPRTSRHHHEIRQDALTGRYSGICRPQHRRIESFWCAWTVHTIAQLVQKRAQRDRGRGQKHGASPAPRPAARRALRLQRDLEINLPVVAGAELMRT